MIRDFRPDVMIGVGGYASGPAMLAAAMMNVPMMAFEPNVVPGIANRLVAPMVQAAAVHFAATQKYFRNAVVTGVPVRQEFFAIPAHRPDNPPNASGLRWQPGRPRHQCRSHGGAYLHWSRRCPAFTSSIRRARRITKPLKPLRPTAGISAEVSPFIDDMPGAFARADLLICRSGASTVAEITAAGKPAIFVPLPTAADDHQRHNAETLANAGAARPVAAGRAHHRSPGAGNRLPAARSRAGLTQMGAAARQFAHPDAAAEIAAMAARIAGVRKPPTL